MIEAYEAVIDERGIVRLLDPMRVQGPRRALLVVLDSGPATGTSETALLSQESLAQDWDRPEEDSAWSHLQQGLSS